MMKDSDEFVNLCDWLSIQPHPNDALQFTLKFSDGDSVAIKFPDKIRINIFINCLISIQNVWKSTIKTITLAGDSSVVQSLYLIKLFASRLIVACNF
jgi:hypothetical protein